MTAAMEKRLRLLQVVNVRWFNASAWYGLFLSRLLKEAGHEVLVLCPPGTDSLRMAEGLGLDPLGIDLNSAGPLRIPFLLRALKDLLRTFRPHLVNCHRGEGMILWGLLKAGGFPFALVRTRGDQRPPRGNLPNRLLHTRCADAVIVTNSRALPACARRLGLPPDRLHLIVGGVDREHFRFTEQGRREMRAAWGFAEDHLVVGILGRFDPVKGQTECIRAVASLRAGTDNAPWRRKLRLLLAGFPAGLSREFLESRLAEAGLDAAAVISGKCPDVPALISAMDIGLVASQGSEAIARAALEIMACRRPLVGTDVGVMPDLLPADALVPPGDPAALARLLERAVLDIPWRRRLQDALDRRMLDLSGDAFLHRTLAVYAKALARAAVCA
ncbi:MAG: glycosyltransferase [Desulfovibrio sp.]|jgi:glycosyltransferase involved in cell wall biosynthesis|nr:glycosyltransferase [Desulfovibrio sp.]